MSLSKKEIEKIYNLKDKLELTYKSSLNEKQKKRLRTYLSKLDHIINHIEKGAEIDFSELNIFSLAIKEDKKDILDEYDRINYSVKIDNYKISEHNKDYEMDQIYSFFIFFENNFLNLLGTKYLKLDYTFNKRRDLFFAHYDSFKILLNQFIDDLTLLYELRFNNQVDQYKTRLEQQKKFLLVKLSELLHELNDFVADLTTDLKTGKNGFINPDDVYTNKFSPDKNEFDGFKISEIIDEIKYYSEDFIEILRMPDFRKNI